MKKKFILVLLLGFPVLAALGAFIAIQYLRYRNVSARFPEFGAPIRIDILQPAQNSESPAGQPLLVDATALGPSTLVSLELWANGKLVGVQAAPADGITPFSATFAWIPNEAGNYTLIVRAHDKEEQVAASDTLNVLVSASEKTGQSNAAQTGGNAPAYYPNGTGGEGPSPSGSGAEDQPAVPLPNSPSPPAPNDTVDLANPWLGDPVTWISQVLVNKLPAPPEMTALANGCGATLNIHDLSKNEEGFFVYRQLPNIPGWKRIATLNAQSKNNWLRYEDTGYAGAITYYAASFNKQGEAPGNLASVQVNPQNCQIISNPAPVVAVQLTDLKIDASVGKAYCYQSFDNVHWTRIPTSEFFLPGENGFDTKSLTQNILLDSQLNNPLSSLDLECWGWSGDALQFLGKLHQDVNLQTRGDVTLTGPAGLFANYKLTDGSLPPQPTEWFDHRMPLIAAHASTDVNDCKDNMLSEGEAILFCFPYSEYAPDPQPYLWWAVFDAWCDQAGAPDGPNCKSMGWYQERAETYGGQVGFRIWFEHVDGPFAGLGHLDYAYSPNHRKAYTVPPLIPYDADSKQANLCGTKTRYWVQPFYDAGPNDPTYANILAISSYPDSADFIFHCSEPPTQVTIDVTIDTIHLGNVDDGGPLHDIPINLELYGSFQVNTSSSLSGSAWGIRNLGEWGYGDNCPNDNFTGGLESGGAGLECAEPFVYGDYDFKDLGLCKSDSYQDCNFNGNPTQFMADNNTIHITVKEGDAIIMHTTLIDYDSGSGDDNVCVGTISTAHKSLDTWLKTDGIWTMVQGDNGNASCQMHFRLKAVQP